MTAQQLNDLLRSLVDKLPEKSVDRVIYGDPNATVRSVAVAWMPYSRTVIEAADLGANVMVVHEPTFYNRWDLDADPIAPEQVAAKKRLLDARGITVLRCHDVWDAMPDIGIPFAWGEFLGLGQPISSVRHYNVYRIPSTAAAAVVQQIAARTATLGQDTVAFYGDPDRPVSTIGLGTGCISDPFAIYGLGADLAISVDDVMRAWEAGEWCRDTGNPLVVVNHCVSEEPGMATLAQFLKEHLGGIPVTHIHQGLTYTAISAKPGPGD